MKNMFYAGVVAWRELLFADEARSAGSPTPFEMEAEGETPRCGLAWWKRKMWRGVDLGGMS